jgi:ERCC4-type nuclease
MIYFDPTEDRKGSKVPWGVIEISHPLEGLESSTGADFLITPSEIPLTSVLTPAGKAKFPLVLENGMLIQRKSGMDLLSSIPHMSNILLRMMDTKREIEDLGRYPPTCWLLVVGFYESSIDGYVKLGDGYQTQLKWTALQGALDAWQYRGGMLNITWSHWEEQVVEWMALWNKKLPDIRDNRDKVIWHEEQSLIRYSDPRLSILMGLPGMGFATASTILEKFKTVQRSFNWILEDGTGVKGVGQKKIEKWRESIAEEKE